MRTLNTFIFHPLVPVLVPNTGNIVPQRNMESANPGLRMNKRILKGQSNESFYRFYYEWALRNPLIRYASAF